MALHCEQCGRELKDTARFCKYCGANVVIPTPVANVAAGPPPPIVRGPAPSAPVADSNMQFCEYCSNKMPLNAQFCNHCGRPVAGKGCATSAPPSAIRPRQLPRREIIKTSGESNARSVAELSIGSKIAGIGGIVALIGCFLPLASGMGAEGINIIPSAVKQTPQFMIVPLCAIALAFIAWGAAAGSIKSRIMLGGGMIALGSPWAVVLILLILGVNRIMSGLGTFGGMGGIGVGVFALALGFAAGVVGGFMILHENTSE